MAAASSVPLSKTSQRAFIEYYKQSRDLQRQARSSLRLRMEEIDRTYQREMDAEQEHLRAKEANKAGNTDRFQNITVPVVMPQVESATTYQASVFLTGYPLFGVVASPQFMDEATQMETVIDEQSVRGGWTRDFLKHFRDGFKYNFAPLEVSWEQSVTATVETDLAANIKEGIPKDILWAGNNVKRLDPYNVFVDPRVDPTAIPTDGEFAGYVDFMTRIKLKSFIASLPDTIIANIQPAFASGLGSTAGAVSTADSEGYYIPDINSDVNMEDNKGGTNWLAWAGMSTTRNTNMDYKDTYEVTTLYCRILPAEFSLRVPNRNIPQVYKLIIVNHEHIVYCEKQTNAHNLIPILIGQPLEDGLGYQTKSLGKNAQPFQEVASAYMNSIIHSRRRAISDRVLYDPSRITAAHINSANPSAKIPVRPAAFGKKISDSVYQFPYREDQASTSMQQIQALLGLANNLSGQNQASQGQFVKGNKTLHEFESVMQNANGRDQIAAILLEAQVFTPLKHILKLNILQYQGGTTIYNRDKEVAVEIDPIALRKTVLEFKVSDGLIPSSKLINGESLATALQVIGSSPEISGGYNIAPMFSYLMKTQGAKLTSFEKSPEQMAYEQAMGAWQQMMQFAIEKGLDPEANQEKLPPQPLPQDYGYEPAGQKAVPKGEEGAGTAQAQGRESASAPAQPAR